MKLLRLAGQCWRDNPTNQADSFGRSLLVASDVPQSLDRRCELARESAQVANDPKLRDLARQASTQYCAQY